VGRANKLQAELETAEGRWKLAQNELLERVKRAEEEVQPKRLQAKVREQWPTIESELQYFLEWVITNRKNTAGKRAADIVAEYVMEVGND
jgi:hypothetical protein